MESKKMGKQDYHPSIIEKKWQKIWDQNRIYSPNLDKAKKPFYNLMMFPYPSAEGMHVGNMYAFTGADIYGRFKRMQGFDVFEPIGLDGFGIHSENYAIKVGRHPKEQAKISEKNFYRQLRATGNGFDWSRKLETYDPNYYKWTQWLFIQLFKAGIAYRKKAAVNFCPSDKTVLADEQVVDGKCERCGSIVEKKELEQWFFRITKYADRLLSNIDNLNWTEKVKIAQRNWIGRSEGARVSFVILNSFQDLGSSGHEMLKQVQHDTKEIEVFTTRPDTLYGATFIVVSPEHPIVAEILKRSSLAGSHLARLRKYVENAKKNTQEERMAEGRDPSTGSGQGKTGVFSGLSAINPANQEKIPIWIADYVLMGYGTGAIMGVPAHDSRDYEFAKKYKLSIKNVILSETKDLGDSSAAPQNDKLKEAYTGEGKIINSEDWNGWSTAKDIGKVIDWITSKGIGKGEVTYHLRDWLISRQRYWGPPIPMIYCEACAKKGNSASTLTKKSSLKEDYLVNLKADSLNGWPDTLESNISKQNKNVNSQFKKGMDSPGVEPGRFGVSSQPSKPAEPMPELVYKSDDEFVNDWNSTGWFPVQEKDLPVLLPDVSDWKPKGTGKSPLATVESFVETTCPNCKNPAKRETDISDNFLDSAWYFLRYVSTDIESIAFDIERAKKWLPVKMYIGGAEHSVLHLLYSRFITMVLKDLRLIGFDEPFSRFYAHGLLVKEGAKMSKSRGNVVVPDHYIAKFGADTLRMYLMFLGPFNQGGDFYDTALEGMYRFIKRVWSLVSSIKYQVLSIDDGKENINLDRVMHKTIQKVTKDIAALRYNTAIAHIMEYYNSLHSFYTKYKILNTKYCKTLVLLLAPFAPHMAEELWQQLKVLKYRKVSKVSNGERAPFDTSSSIHFQPWPTYDPRFLEEDEVTIVVQVNGKMRETIKVESGKLKVESYVQELAKKSERVGRYLDEKKVKRVVYVEGKIINFVTD